MIGYIHTTFWNCVTRSLPSAVCLRCTSAVSPKCDQTCHSQHRPDNGALEQAFRGITAKAPTCMCVWTAADATQASQGAYAAPSTAVATLSASSALNRACVPSSSVAAYKTFSTCCITSHASLMPSCWHRSSISRSLLK